MYITYVRQQTEKHKMDPYVPQSNQVSKEHKNLCVLACQGTEEHIP
jgi:hypothetical protein